ncbi:MAG: protein-disulfide reductase DsbD [Mesorhizobium sp.]|nr:protein-disulfide reductase DsbD [Mesorhizobium sp.]
MSLKSIRSALVAVVLALIASLLASPGFAQVTSSGAMPLPPDQAFRLAATRVDDGLVRLEWTIATGYYLYQDRFALKLGQEELAVAQAEGNPQSKDDPTFGVTTVYHDRAALAVPLAGDAGSLEVRYQGCQENGICYPPQVRHVDAATLAVASPGDHAATALASQWSAPEPSAPSSPIAIADNDSGMVGSLLARGGVVLVLGSFMLFGMLLAFTPCVFPMYPILAGTIARQGEAPTLARGFALSLAYVLAMASAFGLLGVAAAWSGQNLQMALQSPLAIGAVSALFLVFALSMFGLFELQLPSAWVKAVGGLGRSRRGSLASAALLGFTSALIVGPCVTAPLAGALIYIAQTGDVTLGAASLFALGLGQGVPLIIFGTLGPKALPRAGAWMNAVRQAFGFIFIATAIWMLSRLLPPQATLALWALFAIGIAVWLGAFDALSVDAGGARRTAKAAGLAAGLYGAVLAVGAASGADDPLRPLSGLVAMHSDVTIGKSERIAFHAVGNPGELQAQIADADGRPSLLYVTADWCVTCTVIDRSVLPDPAIQAKLAGFNLVELDVSDNSPVQRQMMQSLQVAGPPTMIFVDANGREKAGTRLVGDVTKTTLKTSASRMESAQ